ncbi:MAG: response regulator transcription factor [Planctomycetes bacterium]|nr:response regulator transcription factor [Planctomycetota bacterium]
METATKQANIFFVDDEVGIRKIVRLTLEEELPCYVTCFDNAKDCLVALKEEQRRCSLLITDIKMPGMDGMTLLTKVRQLRPLLPIFIITGHGDVPMAVKALKIGALDFIEKPLDEHVLLPAVEAALKRSANTEDLSGKPLTNSETRILQLIAEGKSNSEMAAFLHRSIRTIERHRYQLMFKLNVSSPAELTKVALALGLTSPEIN